MSSPMISTPTAYLQATITLVTGSHAERGTKSPFQIEEEPPSLSNFSQLVQDDEEEENSHANDCYQASRSFSDVGWRELSYRNPGERGLKIVEIIISTSIRRISKMRSLH